MKKKITSLILIVAIILLPFSIMLKAKATSQTANGITYDDATTKSGDSSSYLITGTATIAVYEGESNEPDREQTSVGDTFGAYKVLDAFYNPNTNQVSYDFTSTFATFVGTLTTAQIQDITGDNEATTFTVNDYLGLMSDNNTYENNNVITGYSDANITSATGLAKLASYYATYVRTKNNNASNADDITPISMTNGTAPQNPNIGVPQDATATYVASCTAAAGSYLILPANATVKSGSSTLMTQIKAASTYGTLVANVVEKPNGNNWQLSTVAVYLKKASDGIYTTLAPYTATDVISALLDENDPNAATISASITASLNLDQGQEFTYFFQGWENSSTIIVPNNAAASITSNTTIMNKLDKYEITLPTGVTLEEIEHPVFTDCAVSNGTITCTFDNDGTPVDLDVGTVSGQTITFTSTNFGQAIFFLGLSINTSSMTPGTASNIVAKGYYLKDAYRDITGMTQAEAEAAVLGEMTIENALYTFGVKITNTNDDTTPAALQGAKFKIYSDSACTEQIGSEVTVSNSNGIVNFVGIGGNDQTYYIKQTSAPTGYNIISSPIALDTSTATLDANNYYNVSAVNTRQGFLPFTGGTGTIIYTGIGLLIVLGAVFFIIIYKKKNKKEDDK